MQVKSLKKQEKTYLPLKFDKSDIFPRKIIDIRPDVHITVSDGTLPDKTERNAGTTAPVFELSYNRNTPLCGEVDGIPVNLQPGYASLGFLGHSAGHSEYNGGEEVLLYSIWVGPEAFGSFCKAVSGRDDVGLHSFLKSSYFCQSFKSDAREESIIHKLDVCFSQNTNTFNKLLLESYLLELLSINIEKLFCGDCHNRPGGLTKTDMEQLEYAREVLLSRLDAPPSLLELSRIVHMNDCKLKRGFKCYYGKTVYEFVREQRLEKAFSLLERGGCNVSGAAFAVGYTNVSHFSAAFQKKYGISPRGLL